MQILLTQLYVSSDGLLARVSSPVLGLVLVREPGTKRQLRLLPQVQESSLEAGGGKLLLLAAPMGFRCVDNLRRIRCVSIVPRPLFCTWSLTSEPRTWLMLCDVIYV